MSSASTDRRVLGPLTALTALLLSPEAAAQGCAACKTAAEQSGNGAFNTAILVLLIPTLCIFGGIVYRAYRHR